MNVIGAISTFRAFVPPLLGGAVASDRHLRAEPSRAWTLGVGMVHNPVVSGAELARFLIASADFEVDVRYRLLVHALDPERLAQTARKLLDERGGPHALESELERLLDCARLHGISSDGALLLVATRRAKYHAAAQA